ncbi:MAG: hypothetical protein AB7S26_31395 [Sandaracinaceae bacterium]
MLERIQAVLAQLYDLEPGVDVRAFLCGRDLLAALERDDQAHRGEVLLVLDDDEGVHVGLYLDPAVLARLDAGHEDLRSVALATEGVSHFLYLSFRADNAMQVTQLELELQAEVDKYATAILPELRRAELSGNGVGVIRERSRALRERLYERASFIDDGSTDEGERYRVAHRAAARYAARLEERYVRTGRIEELVAELRRFYRLGAREKLERASR